MDRISFEKSLKAGQISGVYVFDGKEEYLKEKTLKLVESTLMPAGFEALNENVFDQPDINLVYESALAVPFMCDKRLVIAKDPPFMFTKDKDGDKKDTSGDDSILERLNALNAPNSSCVVILYLRAANTKTRARIIKKLDESRIISFGQLDEYALKDWIKRECQAADGKIDDSAATELIADCSGSMSAIRLELDKLIAYRQGEPIRLQDVQELVAPSIESNVFHMLDAMIGGNTVKALEILNSMIEHNESGFAVLSALTMQLRRMCFVKSLYESRHSMSEIQSSLDIKDWQARNSLNQARPFSVKLLKSLYESAVDTETRMKSGKISEIQGLYAMLIRINAITQKQRNK